MTEKTEPLSAAEKTIVVLKAAIEHKRFSEIVSQTGLPKATVHRILQTLIDYCFVASTTGGEYLPGAELFRLGGKAFYHLDISKVALPHLDKLAEDTGFTVHLGVLNKHEATYLAKVNGNTPYHIPSGRGQTLPLHTTAIGKAMLASFTDKELEDFAHNARLTAQTPNSITSLKALEEDIVRIQKTGFSFDDEENVPGIRCIGAPIFDIDGKAKYGISMTSLAMENSIQQLESYSQLILQASREISKAIGCVSPSY